jgi:TPP-dependent pyruvate/acetoin dehydrogenase alpha subunit
MDYLELYRGMLLIRQCEAQLARSRQHRLIHGACHTYVGQEAIAAGVYNTSSLSTPHQPSSYYEEN